MAKFGRFKFGKVEPSETQAGDRMTLEKRYVKILAVAISWMVQGY
jgi:hypothetical protein